MPPPEQRHHAPASVEFALLTTGLAAAAKRRKCAEGGGDGARLKRRGDVFAHNPKPKQEERPEAEAKELVTEEDVRAYRKARRIRVDATDAPSPVVSLREATERGVLHARVAAALRGGGFAEMTPCQAQCFPLFANGFDVLCCAPTGSGKTLAFIAPALSALIARRAKDSAPCTHAVLLTPSRELAAQTARVLKALAGGASVKVRVDATGGDGSASRNGEDSAPPLPPDFIVGTPDACASKAGKLGKVRILILDEADRLLLDPASKEHVELIAAKCTSKHLRIHLFSATIPESVDVMARQLLHNAARVYVGVRNTPVSHVRQQLVYTGHTGQETGKMLALKSVLRGRLYELGGSFGGAEDGGDGAPDRVFPCLIFCRSVARCQALFTQVRALFASYVPGVDGAGAAARRVAGLHGGMTAKDRHDALTRFRSGEAWVLVATDVLSRGVDFAGVRLVLNYDFPATAADYVHRVGRAGRAPPAAATANADAPLARAVTLYTDDDAAALRPCAALIREAGGGAYLPPWIQRGVAPPPPSDGSKRAGKGALAAVRPSGWRRERRRQR